MLCFHETKAGGRQRKRQKQGSRRKQKRKTGRKEKGQEEERDKERKIEKGGGQHKLRRNKGRHSKINKKMPFSRGKTRFLYYNAKKGEEKKKEGLEPSEVALWATSPNP